MGKEARFGELHIDEHGLYMPTLAYSLEVEREDEVDADRFVRAVRRAKRH
ncbi:MAG: hypothetical protein U1E26_03090 [Coriobacteriia bacterium]|nr:hypothetical protein [Coriobacteriia bacterium]